MKATSGRIILSGKPPAAWPGNSGETEGSIKAASELIILSGEKQRGHEGNLRAYNTVR